MSNPQPDVLSQITEFIARYLQCSEHQRTILALWVLHTYCFPAAQVTPYLSIRSAYKQSGKTLCLQLLALLCDSAALTSGGVKASDLAQPMQAKPISALLLDECHATIGTRSRSKGPTLRALFASSFHLLHGHSNIAQERNAFCPKAFAGQGRLPEELADRSIPIILEPLQSRVAQPPSAVSCSSEANGFHSAILNQKTQIENHPCSLSPVPCHLPERFNLRHAIDQVQPIRNRLNHWADVHLLPLLDQMSPLPRSSFPPNLSPRQQDIVEPLLQLAGLIGGPWPRRALQAFAIIFDLQTHFDLLPNLQLLADVRNCFAYHGDPQRLSTNDLLDWLHSLPARPWATEYATEYDGDGPLTPYKVARLLRPFAIRPRNQRIGKDDPARGYQLEDFHEPWKKYFDPEVSPSEIVNKACPRGELASRRDGLCNTVSHHGTVSTSGSGGRTENSAPASLSPAAGPGEPWVTCNLSPKVTCSPECELEAGRTRKSQNQNDDLPNLSTQQIQERKEALMRELAPLFSQPAPARSSPNAVNHGLSASTQANVTQNSKPQPKTRVDRSSGSRRGDRPRSKTRRGGLRPKPRVAGLAASSQQLEASHTKQPTAKPAPAPKLEARSQEPKARCGELEAHPSKIINKACPRLPRLAVGGDPAQRESRKDAVCNTVAAIHTTAVRRGPDVVKDPGRSSLSPAAGPSCPGLPWGVPPGRRVAVAPEARRGETNLSPMERLTGLHNSLRLDGAVNLPAMASRYTLEDLKARLDWAETNTAWNLKLMGKSALEFFNAFDEIGVLMKDNCR